MLKKNRTYKVTGECTNVEYRVDDDKNESSKFYRNLEDSDVVVVSALFVKIEYLEKVRKYNEANFPFD